MKRWHLLKRSAVILTATLGLVNCVTAAEVGFDDTPFLPGNKWRVHDSKRPHPPVIQPGACCAQEQPCKAPSDAIVLFDGKNLSQWAGDKGEAQWKIENGYMEANKTGSIRTKEGFGSCQLHVEWATPKPAVGESQGRGNSGVFLMSRYEMQVLDSYENETYADGQAGAIYGQTPPLVNVCRPPGEWQSYDITFNAPKFQDGKLVKPAYVTILQNGVLVQNHTEIIGATAHKTLAKYSPHSDKEPISLQDHHNPIRFRNIWIRPLKDSE